MAYSVPAPREDESVGALVQRLRTDVERIVRTEVAVLQVRGQATARVAKTAGMGLVAAGVLGVGGVSGLVAGAILVLARVMPAWIAALAIGGGLVLAAIVVALIEVRVLTRGVNDALAPADEQTSWEIPNG